MGCRTARSDTDLIRVVLNHRSETGQPVPAVGQHGAGGRGAWLCRDPHCIDSAGKAGAFSRAFRSKLADRDFADTLLGWFTEQG